MSPQSTISMLIPVLRITLSSLRSSVGPRHRFAEPLTNVCFFSGSSSTEDNEHSTISTSSASSAGESSPGTSSAGAAPTGGPRAGDDVRDSKEGDNPNDGSSKQQKGDNKKNLGLKDGTMWKAWTDPAKGSGNPQKVHNDRHEPRLGHEKTSQPPSGKKPGARGDRFVQERIVSILLGENEDEMAMRTRTGYSMLGTAKDAPSVNLSFTKRADEISPDRINPHRLFYPGMMYTPEDLNPYSTKGSNAIAIQTRRREHARPKLSSSVVVRNIDFRNVRFLSGYLTETGKLISRKQSNLSAKMQRALSREVKLARNLGLLRPTTKFTPLLMHGRLDDEQRRRRG